MVMSDTARYSVSSLTRTAPRLRTPSAISWRRCSASIAARSAGSCPAAIPDTIAHGGARLYPAGAWRKDVAQRPGDVFRADRVEVDPGAELARGDEARD